jgi:hypothetical protein
MKNGVINRIIYILSVLKIGRIIKKVVRFAAEKGMVSPFVWLYKKVIKEVLPEDGNAPENKPTLLAIHSERFGNELDLLANTKEFRVLKLSLDWQIKILNIFWPSKIWWRWKDYYDPDPVLNREIIELQNSLRKFLRKFLSRLYRETGVNAVLGATFYYKQDYDWGLVSNDIGVPYIVIQYDRIFGGRNRQHFINKTIKTCKRFRGSHIIVSNDYTRDTLIETGYVDADRISSLGLMRMDGFVRKVLALRNKSSKNVSKKTRKRVTLFSFVPCVGLRTSLGLRTFPEDPNLGYQKLFENVHTSIARLAESLRDVDFIVKTKWGGIWFEGIEKACRKNGYNIRDIPNLTITDNVDSHELIIDSDVICGFSTTALLEAAVAAKPVIVPMFDEAMLPMYQESIGFLDCYHLFDCAGSVTEFEELITGRLHDPGPKVSGEYLAERDRMFEKHVSSMRGESLNRYVKTINAVINECKCKTIST